MRLRMTKRDVFQALSVFVFVSMLTPSLFHVSNDISASALLLVMMTWLIVFSSEPAVFDSKYRIVRRVIVWVTIFLIIWILCSTVKTEHLFRAGRPILSFGQGLLIIFIACRLIDRKMLENLSKVVFGLIVMTVCFSLLGLKLGYFHDLMFQGSDRSSGFHKNPNQYGIFLNCCFSYALARAMLRPGRNVLVWCLVVFIFIGLALSGSKTNIVLSVLSGLLIFSFCSYKSGRFGRVVFIVPIVGVVLLFNGLEWLELLNPRASRILSSVFQGGVGDTTLQSRWLLWEISLDAMISNPLFGRGAGTPINSVHEHTKHSHNMFLEIGRSSGIPALIALVVLSVVSIVFCLRSLSSIGREIIHYDGIDWVVGSCFAVLMYLISNQMSDSFGPSTSVIFWLSLSIVLNQSRLTIK